MSVTIRNLTITSIDSLKRARASLMGNPSASDTVRVAIGMDALVAILEGAEVTLRGTTMRLVPVIPCADCVDHPSGVCDADRELDR